MRLVMFQPAPGCDRLGLLIGDRVLDLALASSTYKVLENKNITTLPDEMMSFLNQGEQAIHTAKEILVWAKEHIEKNENVKTSLGEVISYKLQDIRLRAPVPRPPKILCLALNYVAHGEEANAKLPGQPYVFIKPGFKPVVGPRDTVIKPPQSQNFVFEGELAVVIGKSCYCVPKDQAYDVIAGYTVINDMSARDLGMSSMPQMFDWFQAKAFDTSLPMGPCLTLKDEIPDPHSLRLQVRVNGKTAQDASTAEMLFKIPKIIEFISDLITLEPGDIICTGTPGGSKGALNDGDNVEVEIDQIGILPNVINTRVKQ